MVWIENWEYVQYFEIETLECTLIFFFFLKTNELNKKKLEYGELFWHLAHIGKSLSTCTQFFQSARGIYCMWHLLQSLQLQTSSEKYTMTSTPRSIHAVTGLQIMMNVRTNGINFSLVLNIKYDHLCDSVAYLWNNEHPNDHLCIKIFKNKT